MKRITNEKIEGINNNVLSLKDKRFDLKDKLSRFRSDVELGIKSKSDLYELEEKLNNINKYLSRLNLDLVYEIGRENINRKKEIRLRRFKKREKDKLEDKKMNEQSKNPETGEWDSTGNSYTDEEFKIAIEGDTYNRKDLIRVGILLGYRRATAIRTLRTFRNYYLKMGYDAFREWGRCSKNIPKDYAGKLDSQADQLRRIIDPMPGYWEGFE